MGNRVGWKKRIFQRDKWLCYYCRCNLNGRDSTRTDFATIDHKLPLSRGGMSTQNNMVAACQGCNNAKGSMTVTEYEVAGKPRHRYAPRFSAGSALKYGVRTAQAIEARRAETLGSVEDESAVAKPCAQKGAA